MDNSSQPKYDDTNDLEFVKLGDQLANHHANHGVRMRPYTSADVPHFSKVPSPYKPLILSALRENVLLFDEMSAAGEPLIDSPRLLWRSLRRLNWTPRSDIFDKIEDGDVVELYDGAKNQIFRNLAFFNYISLTLEEIVSFPLGVMFNFDPSVLEYHDNTATRIAQQAIHATETLKLAPYIVEEKGGEFYRVKIHPKWISPVSHNDKCVGVIVVHRSELLNGS